MAGVLIAAGADVHGPLYACSSCDNVPAATLLLDGGAAVNGSGGWSPIEEALYWNSQGVICLLLERGASIHNLRIAAGLGRTDVVETFFAADGFDYAGTGLHCSSTEAQTRASRIRSEPDRGGLGRPWRRAGDQGPASYPVLSATTICPARSGQIEHA